MSQRKFQKSMTHSKQKKKNQDCRDPKRNFDWDMNCQWLMIVTLNEKFTNIKIFENEELSFSISSSKILQEDIDICKSSTNITSRIWIEMFEWVRHQKNTYSLNGIVDFLISRMNDTIQNFLVMIPIQRILNTSIFLQRLSSERNIIIWFSIAR